MPQVGILLPPPPSMMRPKIDRGGQKSRNAHMAMRQTRSLSCRSSVIPAICRTIPSLPRSAVEGVNACAQTAKYTNTQTAYYTQWTRAATATTAVTVAAATSTTSAILPCWWWVGCGGGRARCAVAGARTRTPCVYSKVH